MQQSISVYPYCKLEKARTSSIELLRKSIPLLTILIGLLLVYLNLRYPGINVETSSTLRYITTVCFLLALGLITLWHPGLGIVVLLGLAVPLIVAAQKYTVNYHTSSYAPMLVSSIVWFKRSYVHKSRPRGRILLLAFVFWIAVEAVRTVYFYRAANTLLETILMFIAIYIVIVRLERGEIELALRSYLMGNVLTAVWLLARYDWGGSAIGNFSRLGTLLGLNPNVLSANFVMSLVYIFSVPKDAMSRLYRFFAVVALGLALLLTGTRAGVISVLIGLTAILVVRRGFSNNGVIAIALVSAYLAFHYVSDSGSYVVWRYMELFEAGKLVDLAYVSIRARIWEVAWKVFLSNPLFGVGLGNLGNFTAAAGLVTHDFLGRGPVGVGLPPHSLYMTILPETGAVGLLLFALWSMVFLKDSLSSTGWSPLMVGWLTVFYLLGALGAYNMSFVTGWLLASAYVIGASALERNQHMSISKGDKRAGMARKKR